MVENADTAYGTRRAEIIEAARDLYESQGLGNTTVKDITERAGVSRSLFYHYFEDKTSVTEAVLDAYADNFREMVEHWNSGRVEGDVRGALRDSVKMIRRGVFEGDSFHGDLACNETSGLYLSFATRTADVLARYVTETTVVDYARFHNIRIDNIYETFYLLIIGMIGYVRSRPETSDEVLEAIVAQTLRLDLDNEDLVEGVHVGEDGGFVVGDVGSGHERADGGDGPEG